MSTTPKTDPLAAAMGPSGSITPPTPAELAAHLPDLEIEALIGQGGMGAVYRVRRRADGKLLALKVVRPEAGKEAAFTARFAREAEALERLRHANIVAIHGHGAAGPWCWLLMDLIEGANLREIVATGRLSPAQTLALVPPLCAALQYAHDQGVVHRDLKPENILLDAAGVPHLVDFGLAKLRDGAAGSDLTNTGAGMGTVHYMAPEQVASAKDVDHRADIYALGVVLYELLTGQLPLGRFEAPSQRVQVDLRIDEVVLKALERDPERRWQQMRQVGQAVAAADVMPAGAIAGIGLRHARSRWRWAAFAGGLAVAIAIVLFLFVRMKWQVATQQAREKTSVETMLIVAGTDVSGLIQGNLPEYGELPSEPRVKAAVAKLGRPLRVALDISTFRVQQGLDAGAFFQAVRFSHFADPTVEFIESPNRGDVDAVLYGVLGWSEERTAHGELAAIVYEVDLIVVPRVKEAELDAYQKEERDRALAPLWHCSKKIRREITRPQPSR